jgi:uncharacterized protein YndB with AHSA1/START domain
MERLNFSIVIDAPKEKVWNTMLGEDTYRLWTEAFMPGSYVVGDWREGSKILFLAPMDTGELAGMVSRIRENRPYEYVSIEHLGTVKNGKEDTSSGALGGWAGALENYTFKDLGDRTEVLVEMDTTEQYREMFQNTWPQALQKLKDLAEK